MSACQSCGAPIRWITSEARRRPMPIDRDPTPDGNVLIIREGATDVARVLGPLEVMSKRMSDPDVDLYLSHFATCPDAEEHRHR